MISPRGLVRQPMHRVVLRARLLRPWRVRRFARFGRSSIVHRPIWLFGPHKMSIGQSTFVLHSAWLSVEPAGWSKPGPVLVIGDRVAIRPFCTISAAESVVIGDDVVLSAFSTVIDADHSHEGLSDNVVYNEDLVTGVEIGRGTWIGERCAILRGARIGKHCTIGSNSVVRGEIPDYAIAVGAPARVVGSNRDAVQRSGRHPEDFERPEEAVAG